MKEKVNAQIHTQLSHVLVHLLDSEMKYFPQVHFRELADHLLRKDPGGYGRTFDDLHLQQLVDDHDHHLLMIDPQLEHVVQNANLRFFCFRQRLLYDEEAG